MKMKTKNLTIALLACAGMCACTSEDIDLSDGSQKVFQGDKAYMTVSISDVGSSTRATDGGLKNGDSNEYAVNTDDAYFYFYDEDGLFVTEGEVWDGNGTSYSNDGNIDFKSSTVVILKGLTHQNYPKYVVTVLNKPKDFEAAETLDGMESKLADEDGEGIIKDDTYFTMSTSSYYEANRGLVSGHNYNFVTVLNERDFYTETVDISNPVQIYVERLAAKVTLGVGDDLAETATNGLYQLTGDNNMAIDDEDADGNVVRDDIYVKLEGWKLNATARKSYIVKNIDPDWTNTGSGDKDLGTGWSWNDAGNYRSYWGMSFNYGLDGSYPSSSNNNDASDEAGDSQLNKYLKYVDLNTDVNALDGSEYCAENTNTAGEEGVIKNKQSSAITSILVKARACDAYGNGLDLVRYNGLLFTQEHFLNYILEHLNTNGKLNIYYETKDDENNTVYKQIDGTYVKLANKVDGKIKVVLADNGTTYYEKVSEDEKTSDDIEATENGETIYLRKIADISSDDYVLYGNGENDDATGYNGGLMYYTIPIQHLNNNYETIAEANYGVVRNHWYQATIKSLENIGKGIFDPNEVIVPDPNDIETYYVGANINILSWKLVEQDVSL